MLKPNIQLFAEPADGGAPAEPGNPAAGGKTFSEDYVSSLRRESAGHRTRAVQAENALRSLLGLKEGEELGDLNTRITTYQQTQEQTHNAAAQKANERLIQAEIRALEGYDTKLLAKLIDRSKITVADDGTVNGLTEAAEAAAEEFPAVRKTTEPVGGTGGKGNFRRDHGDGTDFPKREEILKMPYAQRRALYIKNPQKFNEIMKG